MASVGLRGDISSHNAVGTRRAAEARLRRRTTRLPPRVRGYVACHLADSSPPPRRARGLREVRLCVELGFKAIVGAARASRSRVQPRIGPASQALLPTGSSTAPRRQDEHGGPYGDGRVACTRGRWQRARHSGCLWSPPSQPRRRNDEEQGAALEASSASQVLEAPELTPQSRAAQTGKATVVIECCL